MSVVYLLFTDDGDNPFYTGESTRPQERIQEHVVDFYCTAAKVEVLVKTALRNGSFSLVPVAVTDGKQHNRQIENIMIYLFRQYNTNANSDSANRLVTTMNKHGLAIKPFDITVTGLKWLNKVSETATPFDMMLLGMLLDSASVVQDEETYTKPVLSRPINWNHPTVVSVMDKLKEQV